MMSPITLFTVLKSLYQYSWPGGAASSIHILFVLLRLICIAVLFLTLSRKTKQQKRPFMSDEFTELDNPIIIKPKKNVPIFRL